MRLALQEGSDFRQALAKILPGRTTITIWVYPDGFDAFRQIRKELYRLGYAIAARPLPPGSPSAARRTEANRRLNSGRDVVTHNGKRLDRRESASRSALTTRTRGEYTSRRSGAEIHPKLF